MRSFLGLLVCATLAAAQTGAANLELEKAKAGLEKLRALVEAGAVPQTQLVQAEETLADAQDAALLGRTLYGEELTDAQSEAMIAAADRRLQRRSQAFERTKKLVDAGVAPAVSLDEFQEDLDSALKECDLATSRVLQLHELTANAEIERALLETSVPPPLSERHEGDGVFNMSRFARIETAFHHHFGKRLPVSAMGETDVHRSMGFDHRGRVDVALHPDQPEGVWLRTYLDEKHVPYFVFRQAVAGKATGAHIHLGTVSGPLAHGD